MRTLAENRVRLGALLDVRADEVIAAVLAQLPFRPRYLNGIFQVGIPGAAEIGITSTLPVVEQMVGWELQSGISSFAFVGDDWEDGVLALDAVREVVAAERGRCFVRRDGDIVMFNRQETLLRTASVASFDENMHGLTLTHGADTVSRVGVTLRPRRTGSNDDVLWRLGSSQHFPPKQEVQFIARFRGEAGERIGALDVFQPRRVIDFTANTQSDGNGTDVTGVFEFDVLEAEGTSARIRAVNPTSADAYLVAGSVIRGKALYTGDPITVEAVDGVSATAYGARELIWSLTGLTTVSDAENIACYELARRSAPHTRVTSLALRGRAARPQILARTLFDRITVADGGTGHSGDYFIVGEKHTIGAGGVAHSANWVLEPANPGAFWLVGNGQLGGDTVLAY